MSDLFLNNITNLIISIIPAVFTLIAITFDRKDRFFQKSAEKICEAYDLDKGMVKVIANVAKSSVALKNHFSSMFSGIISLIPAFFIWPQKYRFLGFSVIIFLYIFIFQKWIYEIFSLRLDQIYSDSVPKKKTKTRKITTL